MPSTTLYPVRHAHARWMPDEGRALSPEGHAGAEHVAALLRNAPIVAVYASRARRAIQTVEPRATARGLPVTTSADLRERRLSGAPVDDHGAAVAWCWAHPEAALPGGESNMAAQQRGVAAIITLTRCHTGETIVVGTHGNLLALILQHWAPAVDDAFWSRLTMPAVDALTLGTGASARTPLRWDAGERFMPYA